MFFIVVSAEKLLTPYENLLFVIQGYDIFPPFLEDVAAISAPWFEFFLGVFLALGLWIKPVLWAFVAFICAFILLLAQAIIRQLPLKDCGCYGELLSLPLHVSIMIDVGLLLCVVWLMKHLSQTSSLSLDRFFESKDT